MMSGTAIVFIGGLVAAGCLGIVFSLAASKELVKRVADNVAWLLKIAFFDFVKLVIFLKPLQKHARAVGEVVWLVLLFVVGRYIIVDHPSLTEIDGPYIPMIGYVYLLSLLFMLDFTLQTPGRSR
jgi:hypothetical protein